MTKPGSPEVTVSHVDRVTTITLSAPERLNAVNTSLLEALADAVVNAPSDRRVIVLRGEGRAFCAGVDLSTQQHLSDETAATEAIDALIRAVIAIVDSPTPVVAVVQGACAGAGVPLALAAELVLAEEDAFFQVAFARVGLMPDGGATALLTASLGRARAMRLALTGERVGAAEAVEIGLIAKALPAEILEDEVVATVRALAEGPAVALAHTKRAVNGASLTSLTAAFLREREGQTALLTAGDFAEGARAFAERRAPAFRDREEQPAPSRMSEYDPWLLDPR